MCQRVGVALAIGLLAVAMPACGKPAAHARGPRATGQTRGPLAFSEPGHRTNSARPQGLWVSR